MSIAGVIVSNRSIRRLLDDMADTCAEAFESRLCSPWTNVSETKYLCNDPFTFTCWYASKDSMTFVLHKAAQSDNGRRLDARVTAAICDYFGLSPGTYTAGLTVRRIEHGLGWIEQDLGTILRILEEDWVEWYGDEHMRLFSRVFILVMARKYLFYLRQKAVQILVWLKEFDEDHVVTVGEEYF